MPTIANPFANGKVVDLSAEINVIPNTWGLYNAMGLFREEPKAQKTVLIPRKTGEGEVLLVDRNWDERNPSMKGIDRDVFSLLIPHFPVDDAITPNDIDGKADWDSLLAGGNATLQLEKVRMEKMARIRRAHAVTKEFARAMLIKDGTVYAPNGTIVTNFYTEFNLTRTVINFDLESTTVNPLPKVNELIATMQDSMLTGAMVTDIVVICSPEFFSALIQNPFVYDAYLHFNQPQGPAILSGRLPSAMGDVRTRQFEYGGLTFIEYRGQIAGEFFVEPGEAYAFPRGTDSFRTFYAPANRFASINKTAQESYYFEYKNEKDDIIEVMTETNFLNALLRPQTVITLTVSA